MGEEMVGKGKVSTEEVTLGQTLRVESTRRAREERASRQREQQEGQCNWSTVIKGACRGAELSEGHQEAREHGGSEP